MGFVVLFEISIEWGRLSCRMCREILNTCVRNTEEAERATKASVEGASVSSGRGLGKGVWGMIEESELAKSIRLDEEKKVRFILIAKAIAISD